MNYNIYFPHLHLHLSHVPKSFTVFGFEIALYGIVIAIGMISGTLLARHVAKITGQDSDQYFDFAIIGILISVIGARLYYVVFRWDLYKDHPLSIFNIREGGLAIYGGVIGAIISAYLFSKIKKIPLGLLMDTACNGLILGQIIGRYGNFFNREAFGGYTDNLFAMRLPVSMVRSSEDITNTMLQHLVTIDGASFIQVHPTFLYESCWNIAVLILLLLWRRKKVFDGEVFCLYLIGYGCGRFWIEGLRTDQLLIPSTSLPVSQVLSILLVIAGLCVVIRKRYNYSKKKKPF